MKLAVIAGDGIGTEVTAEALKVLQALRDDVEITEYDLGARRYLAKGETLTEEDLASIKNMMPSCWEQSVIRAACRQACWNAGCCCRCDLSCTMR